MAQIGHHGPELAAEQPLWLVWPLTPGGERHLEKHLPTTRRAAACLGRVKYTRNVSRKTAKSSHLGGSMTGGAAASGRSSSSKSAGDGGGGGVDAAVDCAVSSGMDAYFLLGSGPVDVFPHPAGPLVGPLPGSGGGVLNPAPTRRRSCLWYLPGRGEFFALPGYVGVTRRLGRLS
jgi:hypothetical protein